jgi:hypothetical protein
MLDPRVCRCHLGELQMHHQTISNMLCAIANLSLITLSAFLPDASSTLTNRRDHTIQILMNTPNRKSFAAMSGKSQPQKYQGNHESGRNQKVFAFSDDYDTEHDRSSSSLSDSVHPIDELFHHVSEVVSSIASLHETVCGSWKIFLQPNFSMSGTSSQPASIERIWGMFVASIDRCSEPEVQRLLESQQDIYELPAVGAFSFVRLCQYLVISKCENVEQHMKTEQLILIMGLSRRNRQLKRVIFQVWSSNSRARQQQMVKFQLCAYI